MTELIDRAALLTEYDRVHVGEPGGARALIANAPTVDAVPVVRCKDCCYARELDKYEKQLYLSECVGCTTHSKSYSTVVMMENDYCSYGERKDDECAY